MRRALTVAAAAAAIAVVAAGCGSSGGSGGSGGGSSSSGQKVTLRLGFLENITHASALIGIKNGYFTKDLGPNVTLKLYPFSTGTEEATALLAGQLDAAYVGPNPAIEAFQKSSSLISVISGSASGGADLVVSKNITKASQLKGQKLASPSLGNTQDVAMRYWLKKQGLTTTKTGGGDVPITPISPNSDAVLAFQSHKIAGGWEPEPYASEMVADGGHILVDEASLWPKGQFATTILVATQAFISKYPAAVKGLLKGQVQANSYITSNKTAAEKAANAELEKVSGKNLDPSIVAASFKQITFTDDPIASSLVADAQHAVDVGLLTPVKNLTSVFNLTPLNSVLKAGGEAQVSS